MLATNRTISFAILLYDNPTLNTLHSINNLIPAEVGFNAGDRRRYASIPLTSLQEVNVYRIDGKYFSLLYLELAKESVNGSGLTKRAVLHSDIVLLLSGLAL